MRIRVKNIDIKILAALLLVVSVFSVCKQQYTPRVADVNPNYFVVDGLINTGTDSTIFTLSRTFKLDKNAVISPEKGAIVQVENDAGALQNKIEIGLYKIIDRYCMIIVK